MVINREKTQDILAHLKQKGQNFLIDNALELLSEGKIDLSALTRISSSESE